MSKKPVAETAKDFAKQANQSVIRRIANRAAEQDAVLGPCLEIYERQRQSVRNPPELLRNLTSPLLAAWPTTKARNRKEYGEAVDAGTPQNSQFGSEFYCRSAGTNYQGLVSTHLPFT